jgi:hypothetical protein
MSALSLIRVARKAVGLSPQPAYPNLESLLEVEAAEVHNDYQVLSLVTPPVVAFFGVTTFIVVGIKHHNPFMFVGAFLWFGLAVGIFFGLDQLARQIPQSRLRLRKLSEQIWTRYSGVSNATGIEPALSASVASLLDEAAGIYLRHTAKGKVQKKQLHDPNRRAVLALEEAMVKLLGLAEPRTVSAQELELAAGWAPSLLQEMREMDKALDHHQLHHNPSDPLFQLREARRELQDRETALNELEH